MVLENEAVFFGTGPSEGVGQPVIRSADPDRLCPVVVFDLMRGVESRHPQPVIVCRSSVLDQEEATLRVCVNPNVLVNHLRSPNPRHQEVAKEFQIRDMQVVEVGRRGHRDIIIDAVVICPNTGMPGIPAIGRSIE